MDKFNNILAVGDSVIYQRKSGFHYSMEIGIIMELDPFTLQGCKGRPVRPKSSEVILYRGNHVQR